jgi:nicotinate phosphoribosyltransferase
MIYDIRTGASGRTIVDPLDPTRRKILGADCSEEELLVPVFRSGYRVYDPPPLDELRSRVRQQIARLGPTYRRLVNPHDFGRT